MIILGTNSIKDTGYNVANSCRFNSADSSYLDRTPGSVTSTRKNTFSFWVKRGSLGAYQYIISTRNGTSTNRDGIAFNDSDQIDIRYNAGSSSPIRLTTTRVFRDPTAFMHIVVAVDTEQGTASNRIKVYINGTQETTFATANYMDEDYDFALNAKTDQTTDIGNDARSDGAYFDGYLAEFVAIDGTQNAVTDFGEFDSDTPTVWKPIDVSGLTFGNAGFYLDFENSAELGTDVSGNSNTFSENNLDATDQATDTCTNNFCTLNPLAQSPSDSTGAYSQGNCVYTVSDYNPSARGTFGMSAGKWYWEIKQSAVQLRAGICTSGFNTYLDTDNVNAFFPNNGGAVHVMNTNTGTSWQRTNNSTSRSVDTFTSAIASTSGSIINFAFDADSGKMWWGVNGVYLNSGNPATGSNETLTAVNPTTDPYHCFTSINDTSSISASFNFGGCPSFSISSGNADGNGYGNFEYAPPSGYLSLCTKNLGSDGG